MAKPKLGRGLSALMTPGTAMLATPEAANNDQTAAACRIEETRYERAILDFEASVRRERDRMRAEHLEAMRLIGEFIVDPRGLSITTYRKTKRTGRVLITRGQPWPRHEHWRFICRLLSYLSHYRPSRNRW